MNQATESQKIFDNYNKNLLKRKIIQLCKSMNMSTENASKHLKVIAKEGL